MKIAALLAGGDRRSIGQSNRVAVIVRKQPGRFAELIDCLWSDDPVVRMRAADAAEKASALRPELLVSFKAELLGLLVETEQPEVQWHLAQMVPRLPLSHEERRRAIAAFRSYLNHRGSLVKTAGMQALADLAESSSRRRAGVAQLIEHLMRTGTPAMKARGRHLLKHLRGLESSALR